MKFIIDREIFDKFPDLNVGVLVAKDINNFGISEEVIRSIRDEETRIRQIFDTQTLSENPRIDVWRKAYSLFGAKPKDYLCSVENLHRLVLKGVDIRHINKLVDIYNLVSLKYTVPLGGEDLDKIQGDIKLTLARDDEQSVLLLGDKDPRSPHQGEVIYKDDVSAICRRFNWRESDRTKLTEDTKNAVLVTEGLPPIIKEDMQKVLTELQEIVQSTCGGRISFSIANKSMPEIVL